MDKNARKVLWEEVVKNRVTNSIGLKHIPIPFIPCEEMHHGYCWVSPIQTFIISFIKAIKLYTPIHFIPTLFFKRRELLKGFKPILNILTKSMHGTLQSCLFFMFIYIN